MQTINAIFWLENGKNGCAVLDYITTIQYIVKRCPKNTNWAPHRNPVHISKQDMTTHTLSFISEWLKLPVKYLYIVDKIYEDQTFDIELNCLKNKKDYFTQFNMSFNKEEDFIDFSYLSEYNPEDYDYNWPDVDLRLLEERQEVTDYLEDSEDLEDDENDENKENEEIKECIKSKEETSLMNMLCYKIDDRVRRLVTTRYSQLFCKEYQIMMIDFDEKRVDPTYTIETTTVHLQKKMESSKVYVIRFGMRHIRVYVNDGNDYYGSHEHHDRLFIKNEILDKKMRSVMENILDNRIV